MLDLRRLVWVEAGKGNSILESTCSNTHNNQSDGETSNRSSRMGDDAGNSRDNENGVAEKSHCNGKHDGAESTPVLVGHKGAQKRHQIRPELVDLEVSISYQLLCEDGVLHKVSPVDARWPIPRAPGTASS